MRKKKLFQSDRLKAIICNSEMVKQEILHYFKLPHSKCHVIYSGVDINHFSPQLREKHFETFRKEYQIPGQAIVYLFVGSGFERKGVAPFLKALNQLPDHCYGLVVGADKHLDKYKSLTKKLGILDRVRFTGGLRATAPAYGAADVFVLPTLYDPFANVILEAMASGLPVITSFKSGGAEFIEDGVHGYKCHALDVNHLAKAMTHLQEVDIRTTMGKSAREKVLPFTFEAMSEKTDCFI